MEVLKEKSLKEITDFFKDRYPEINWEQTNYIESTICIWGKRMGLV